MACYLPIIYADVRVWEMLWHRSTCWKSHKTQRQRQDGMKDWIMMLLYSISRYISWWKHGRWCSLASLIAWWTCCGGAFLHLASSVVCLSSLLDSLLFLTASSFLNSDFGRRRSVNAKLHQLSMLWASDAEPEGSFSSPSGISRMASSPVWDLYTLSGVYSEFFKVGEDRKCLLSHLRWCRGNRKNRSIFQPQPSASPWWINALQM